jgi:hypothetical protein
MAWCANEALYEYVSARRSSTSLQYECSSQSLRRPTVLRFARPLAALLLRRFLPAAPRALALLALAHAPARALATLGACATAAAVAGGCLRARRRAGATRGLPRQHRRGVVGGERQDLRAPQLRLGLYPIVTFSVQLNHFIPDFLSY